ncbi:hypothetical protein LguiA_007447 [Lonicera macranthoides]
MKMDGFEKLGADLFSNLKAFIVPKSGNTSTAKIGVEEISEAVTSVLTIETQEYFVFFSCYCCCWRWRWGRWNLPLSKKRINRFAK